MNSTELGNLLFSENMDDSSCFYKLLLKETFGFWRHADKEEKSNTSIENIFDSEEKMSTTHYEPARKVATISFETIDEALKFMSKSFAEFLYQRQVNLHGQEIYRKKLIHLFPLFYPLYILVSVL